MSYFYRTIMFSSFICGLCFIQVKAQSYYEPISIETISNIENLVQLDIGDRDLAFSPDGNYLAIVDIVLIEDAPNYTELYILDTTTMTLSEPFQIPEFFMDSIAFHPSEALLALGSQDGRIAIWSLETQSISHIWQAESTYILSLHFDPSGQILYSGSGDFTPPDGTERLTWWDFQSGTELGSFQPEFPATIHDIAYLQGQESVIVAIGYNIFIGSISNDTSYMEFEPLGYHFALEAIQISVDEMRLFSVGASTISDWRLSSYFDTNRIISTNIRVDTDRPFGWYTIAPIPDTDLILSSDSDNNISVWNTETWEQLLVLDGHETRVSDLSVASHAMLIASAAPNDGTILWGIPTIGIPD